MDQWGQGQWYDPAAEQPDQSTREEGSPAETPREGPPDQPSGWQWAAGAEPSGRADAFPEGFPGQETSPLTPSPAPPSQPQGDSPTPNVGPWSSSARNTGRPASRSMPLPQRGTTYPPALGGAFSATPPPTPDASYWQPPVEPVTGMRMGWGAAFPPGMEPSAPAEPDPRGQREEQERQRKRGPRAVLVVVSGALLIACCAALVVLRPWELGGGPAHQAFQLPFGPTDTPMPTATPTLNPIGAVVSFQLASKQLASPAGMTACPSGCSIPGQSISGSQNFSSGTRQSTFVPQTELYGLILVKNQSGAAWKSSSYTFAGGGYQCQPVMNINLPAGASNNYSCVVDLASPSSISANTIKGTAATNVTYYNPQPLTGNGGYQVLPSDCSAALYHAEHELGVAWGTPWVQGQVNGGWQLAVSPPRYSWDTEVCPVGAQMQTFTASATTHVSDAAFNPDDARNLARSRLDAALDAGYSWKAGSISICAPRVTALNGSKISLQCSDAGEEEYGWSYALAAQLADKLVGISKTQALTICNSTPGVVVGSCQIAFIWGDGVTLPSSASAIAIHASAP